MITRIKVLLLLLFIFGNVFSQPLTGKKTIGATGNYPTIQAAITALVTNGISGTVSFAIQPGIYDEGISLTTSISGLSGTREINFAPTSGSVVWKAQAIIGITSAAIRLGANKRINFNSITFDTDTTGSSGYCIYVDGTADSISFNNCTFLNSDGSLGYGIRASLTNTLGNLTVTNCAFNGLSYGVYYDRSGKAILSNSLFTINNNTFSDMFQALSLDAVGKPIVTNNIVSNFTGTGFNFGHCFIENVSNNKLTSVSGASGFGIAVSVKGKNTGYFGKLYNNMISITNRSSSAYGIYLDNYDSLMIIHNSISLVSNTNSLSLYLNTFLGNNYTIIKNNIFQQDNGRAINFPANPVDRHIETDYNDIISTGTISFINVVSTQYSLTNFQTTFSKDLNSKNKPVIFSSSSDLHLSGSSLGDHDLVGTLISGFEIDIDGNSRTINSPYMGADEVLSNPLPVEMAELNYYSKQDNIFINWSTKSETNNYGWEIESRPQINSTFEKIGFVSGKGTTTSPQSYSFRFTQSANKINIRLKQIDLDGKFTYSNTLTIQAQPESFELKQNYPNPFNPTAKIMFSLSKQSYTELKIYDLLGREIRSLLSEEKPAGNYEISFDGSDLSSGIYIYQLKSGSQVQTKKMILSK